MSVSPMSMNMSATRVVLRRAAPVLKLTAGTAGDDDSAAPAAEKKSTGAAATDASDSTACGLGIAGLVVGVLGLAAAGFAIVRSRATRS